MQIEQSARKLQWKKWLNGLNVFSKAAIVLVFVFLVISLCTIGGFSGGGDSYYAAKDSQVVFYLDYMSDAAGTDAKLEKIYVNVGTVYDEVGKDFQIEFRRATTSGSYSDSKFTTSSLGTVTLGNVYAAEGGKATGTNYNWVKVFDFSESSASISTSYTLIRATFKTEMVVNEIVFVDTEGRVIPAYVKQKDVQSFFTDTYWPSYRDLFASEKKNTDVCKLLDAQDNYTDGDTVYSRFTSDEMYTLMQIDNIRLGGRVVEGAFHSSTDFGPFAVLFPLLGTLVFGVNPFGLRIFPVLFSAGLIVIAYLLGRRLFKHSGFGFLFALLVAMGGLVLTVGRLGLAYSMLAFFILAAYYFMFRFFEDGISDERPVKSAMNILVSGLLFAFAFATDPKCIFALLGLGALFIAGWVRQSKRYRQERAAVRAEALDKNAKESSEETMLLNLAESDRRERILRTEHGYVARIVWLFFIVSFLVASLLITILSLLPSYFTYLKLYETNPSDPTMGIFGLVWAAIKDSFTLAGTTAFTQANAITPFAWFLSLKGATLFSASTETSHVVLNAQLNLGMAITALIGFLFMTIYAVVYFATGKQNGAYASKHSQSILRAYFLLTAGLITSLLQYLFSGSSSAAQSLLFSVFYVGFIALLFYTAFVHDSGKFVRVCGVRLNTTLKVLVGVFAVYALIFLLSVPMLFCIPVAPLAASICYGWTTLLNNGFYRP